jgi:hypothetical protein
MQRRMAGKNRKIRLILDNCAGHPVSEINVPNIELLDLPPNTTSVLQPLDQGIVQNLKSSYRKRLLISYLVQIKSGCVPENFRK